MACPFDRLVVEGFEQVDCKARLKASRLLDLPTLTLEKG